MKSLNGFKLTGLVLILLSMATFFLACDRARFTHNSALPPEIEENDGGFSNDDLDGGSEDTVVRCRQENGKNICVDTGIKSVPVNGTFALPKPTSIGQYPANPDFPGVRCYHNTFTDTKRNAVKVTGVELWLVVDSSNSFDRERVAVAQAILEGYLENCTLGVPVHISVIAAHTPDSEDSSNRGSSPFFSQKGEPVTITIYPGMPQEEFNRAQQNLLVKLDRNMRRDPLSENYGLPIGHSGADELGLLGLSNALKRVPKKPDHALAVIFMSDENDVCMGEFNGDPDGHEKAMNLAYCENVTPEGVYTELRNYAGDRPTILASAVYSGMRPVVNEAPNGIGRGYLDIVEMAGGRSVELSPVSGASYDEYVQNMAADLAVVAGQMTSRFAQFYPHFPVFGSNQRSIDLNSVRINPDNNALDLRVSVDGVGVSYSVDPRYNLITPSRSGNRVVIEYCRE